MIKKSLALKVFLLSCFYLSCFTTPWYKQDTLPDVENRYFPIVSSTQKEMEALLPENLNPEKVLRAWTTNQSDGIGYEDRSWYCPEGNLAVSFGIFWPLDRLGLMSAAQLVTGVSIIKTLKEFGSKEDFYLRWPNDIVSKQGKKISGVLFDPSETYLKGYAPLIIGIGINVRMTEAEVREGQEQPAIKKDTMGLPFTSLFMESGVLHDPFEILEKLTQNLVRDFRTLLGAGDPFKYKFFPFIRERLAYKNQKVTYKTSGKNPVEQRNLTLVDIEEKEGNLLLWDPTKEEKDNPVKKSTGRIFPQDLRS